MENNENYHLVNTKIFLKEIFHLVRMNFLLLLIAIKFLLVHSKSFNSNFSLKNSQSIYEVTLKIFKEKNINFNFLIFGDIHYKFENLAGNIGKMCQKLQKQNVHRIKDKIRWNYQVNQSAIIFMKSLKDARYFFQNTQMKTKFPIEIWFLVIIEDLKNKNNLKNLFGSLNPPEVKNINRTMDFSYFLILTKNYLKLYTIEWFIEGHCSKMTLTLLDIYNKKLKIWKNKLRLKEKFRNFNDCKLISQTIEEKGSAYFDAERNLKGFMIELTKAISQKGNFSIDFQLRDVYRKKIENREHFGFYYLETNSMFLHNFNHITSTFSENKHVFVVTPAEKYSNWEKVMLPFDNDTWKYLGITFSTAFLMVAVVKLLPDFIRILIYGEDIRHPAFNILGTFFGIGQLKLPMENFARIILIFFIFFCLIIRTSYQGVLFEMITTDMRKKPVEHVDEFHDRNFTVFVAGDKDYKRYLQRIVCSYRPEKR